MKKYKGERIIDSPKVIHQFLKTVFLPFAWLFVIFFNPVGIRAQTKALSDDPNFIKSSILIMSSGDLPHQIVGHAAIRMECPEHGLDRVFSFNNSVGNSFIKLLTEPGLGKWEEIYANYYFEEAKQENRKITSFPLNLDLNQKARLWEVLDSLKTLPETQFSLRDSHCFSEVAHAIDLTIYPNYIDWDEPELQKHTYAYLARLTENGNYPWNYLLLSIGMGSLMDSKESGRYFVSPAIFEKAYREFNIYSGEGIKHNLILNNPKVLMTDNGEHQATRPTPVETSLIILTIVLIITICQLLGKANLAGKILDYVLWVFITLGGIFIAYFTFGPMQYGSGWNWVLVIMNPIAWIPIVILKKSPNSLSLVWIIYVLILVLFSAFISIISPSIDPSWRIFAYALAIRCFYKVDISKIFCK